MRRVWSRLRAMLRRLLDRGARDAELSEELRAFVEHDADSKIRSGMTPEEARRAALIELGGAEQVKEQVRDASAGARWGYTKLCRKSGEFATALAVVVTDPARDYTRVVTGAANGAPLMLEDIGELVAGGGRDPEALRSAVGAELDRAADRNFDEFQRDLLTAAAVRAVQQVLA